MSRTTAIENQEALRRESMRSRNGSGGDEMGQVSGSGRTICCSDRTDSINEVSPEDAFETIGVGGCWMHAEQVGVTVFRIWQVGPLFV